MVFGEVVRQHRSARGISQEQLAETAGLHRNHIGFVERGERAPSIDIARQIAVALGLPLSALIAEVERRLARPPSKRDPPVM